MLALLAVMVSIITLASFLKFQKYAFFGKAENRQGKIVKEVPFPMVFSMVVLSILCLVLSLLAFPGIREIILTPIAGILTEVGKYSSNVLNF